MSSREPIPYNDVIKDEWTILNKTIGINNVQTRPQGNLPNFQWGLTLKAQQDLINLYNKVGAKIPL